MSMSDPIADLCTRIRNAVERNHEKVNIPHSRIKENIVDVLKSEGFIEGWKKQDGGIFPVIEVALKYDDTKKSVIRKINRVSKPGLRVYTKAEDLKPVLYGQGIAIVTTSKGVFADNECRDQNIGGEILCQVW